MSLKQWAESTWTKALARGAIILLSFSMPIFFVVWGIVAGNTAAEVAEVKVTQASRANDADALQVEVRKAIGDLNVKVDKLGDESFATRVDVGVIKRLVTELRNQQVADTGSPVLDRPRSAAAVSLPQGQSLPAR